MSAALTVVIPTYARPQMLARCLWSLKCQTEPPAAVIVVNDHPATKQEVDEAIARFPTLPVRAVHHPENRGGNAARNSGLAEVRTSHAIFVDDDDLVRADHVERIAKALRQNPDAAAVIAGKLMVWEKGELPEIELPAPQDLQEYAQRSLYRHATPHLGALAVRVERFREQGGYDQQLGSLQDYEAWLRISTGEPLIRVEGTSYVHVEYAGERVSIDRQKKMDALDKIVAKHKERMDGERVRASVRMSLTRLECRAAYAKSSYGALLRTCFSEPVPETPGKARLRFFVRYMAGITQRKLGLARRHLTVDEVVREIEAARPEAGPCPKVD